MADTSLVRYETDAGVARITLDSPHNRNALSAQLMQELNDGLTAALDDGAVRVIVLSGTGSVFCSGADLKEQRERNEQGETAQTPRVMIDTLSRIWHSPKPVVGRINGHARAGGIGLIGACDLVIAPEDATFGFAEVRIGVVPAVIAVTVVPRLTTQRAALELFLTGENFDARRAAEIGLINRAVSPEGLDDEVERYLGMLRKGGPEAMAEIKRMTDRVQQLPMDEAFEEMVELSLARFASEEAGEGMRAFAEKRNPSWVEEAT